MALLKVLRRLQMLSLSLRSLGMFEHRSINSRGGLESKMFWTLFSRAFAWASDRQLLPGVSRETMIM